MNDEGNGKHNSYHATEDPYGDDLLHESCHNESSHISSTEDVNKCSFCDEAGHYELKSTHGHGLIHYYSCKKL